MFLFIYDLSSEQEHFFSTYHLSQAELDSIHDGDIILRHGYGFVSDMIVEKLKEEYPLSHCAIISKDSLGKCYVIHSVSQSLTDIDGVQQQNLNDFVKDSKPNSIIVVRYLPKINKAPSDISKRAKQYLNKGITFDNSFDIHDSSSFYCSELIWRVILDEYNDDIFDLNNKPGENEIKKLKFFYHSSHFRQIINHFKKPQ